MTEENLPVSKAHPNLKHHRPSTFGCPDNKYVQQPPLFLQHAGREVNPTQSFPDLPARFVTESKPDSIFTN